MPTQHIVRIVLVVPTNRLAALNTWWQARVAEGVLPADNPLQWPELELLNGTAWGRWSNGAYTVSEGLVIARRLCSLANVTPPADLDSRTRKAKKDWLNSQRAAINTATGIYAVFCDNDSTSDEPNWPRFDDALAAKGLRRKSVQI